jgi:hypothetical protein
LLFPANLFNELYFTIFHVIREVGGCGELIKPQTAFFLRYDIFGFDQPGFPLLHTSVVLVHFGRFVVALIVLEKGSGGEGVVV